MGRGARVAADPPSQQILLSAGSKPKAKGAHQNDGPPQVWDSLSSGFAALVDALTQAATPGEAGAKP